MSVTRKGKSIVMTADADAYPGIVFITGLTFQGESLTAGDRVLLHDTGGGVIADYIIEAALDNADLWAGRTQGEFYTGLLLEEFPASGGILTVITG
jgi:hypothetical protein